MSSDACLDSEFPSPALSHIHSIDQAELPSSLFELNVDLTCYEDFYDDNDKMNGHMCANYQSRLNSARSDNNEEELGDWLSNVGDILFDSVANNYFDSTQKSEYGLQLPMTSLESNGMFDILRLYNAVCHKIYNNDGGGSAIEVSECNLSHFVAGTVDDTSAQEVPDLCCTRFRWAPDLARLVSDRRDELKRRGVLTDLDETVSSLSNFAESISRDSASEVASYDENAINLPTGADCEADPGQSCKLLAAEAVSDTLDQFDSNSETSSYDSESSDRRVPVSCTAGIEQSDYLHFIEE